MNTSKQAERVAAVIVTYNGGAWIRGCLTSLKNSHYPVDIIVVDNHSTDQTLSIIKSEFSEVTLLVNHHNAGFGQANNTGISHAIRNKAKFVFLLNQDTTVASNAIANLVDGFYRYPEYDLVSPLHFNGKGNDLDEGFKRYIAPHYNTSLMEEFREGKGGDKVFPVDFVNAAAWLIRVTALKKVGGFAPLFFHYGEDRDFMNRFRYFGLQAGILPSAQIFHFRETRSTDIRKWPYQKKIKYYFVGCLTQSANINHSLPGGSFEGFYWCLKEILVLTVKGLFSAPLIFMQVLIKLIFSIPAIVKHRTMVKKPATYQFLSCE